MLKLSNFGTFSHFSKLMVKFESRAVQPTSDLHNVSGHYVSGLDPLHSFSVLPVHFPHFRLILLKRFDGILSITFLGR